MNVFIYVFAYISFVGPLRAPQADPLLAASSTTRSVATANAILYRMAFRNPIWVPKMPFWTENPSKNAILNRPRYPPKNPKTPILTISGPSFGFLFFQKRL